MSSFFFFNDTATTEIYTLSLHDALPIYSQGADRVRSGIRPPDLRGAALRRHRIAAPRRRRRRDGRSDDGDRKSTRLNSSHGYISYAVFCLKKKNNISNQQRLLRRIISQA